MTTEPMKDNPCKSPKTDMTFHQMEIPGMEEFLAPIKKQSQTTKITLPSSQKMPSQNLEDRTSFHQLKIPGMENLLANPKGQLETMDDLPDNTAA